MNDVITCPVCDSASHPLDVVDLNKSCEELRGSFVSLSLSPVYYWLCDHCGFCFAPEMHRWHADDFRSRIYNQEYCLFDPDHNENRPLGNAALLRQCLDSEKEALNHLDYGGGNGLLSATLRQSGWQSESYDPFYDPTPPARSQYDLVTAFEVFEHLPEIRGAVSEVLARIGPQGALLFSTLLSDGHIHPHRRLTWWYASPRNGHISLFSSDSLHFLFNRLGFDLIHLSENLHLAFREMPRWASGFMQMKMEDTTNRPDTPLTLMEWIRGVFRA